MPREEEEEVAKAEDAIRWFSVEAAAAAAAGGAANPKRTRATARRVLVPPMLSATAVLMPGAMVRACEWGVGEKECERINYMIINYKSSYVVVATAFSSKQKNTQLHSSRVVPSNTKNLHS